MSTYSIYKPTDLDIDKKPIDIFKLDVLMGFSAANKYLPSKYFYDDVGSKLYEKITNLKEYYPFACELSIFENNKTNIAKIFGGSNFNLIELGAGDGRKTRVLLDECIKQKSQFRYVPVDISEYAVKNLMEKLCVEFPSLEGQGIVCEYYDAISWLKRNDDRRNVVLFLGSNIGNFNKHQAITFLRTLWEALNPGDLMLIGFDLKKDVDVMLWAYNDPQDVTSDFNLNVFARINRELGANFDLKKFQHFGTYGVVSGAMESYLISLEEQEVYIEALCKSFKFKEFEPVHMEYSFKYLKSDMEEIARETGFEIVKNFTDPKGYFVDSIWRVVKDS